MKIYNSLTREIEEFIPRDKNLVKVYTCGPTVYSFAHIGNLRTYVMQDVLIRVLKYNDYNVKRIMNITDVGHLASDSDFGEDKMLKSAKKENKSILDIAEFYTNAFFNDCKKLNIIKPDIIEPATNCVDEYIKIISTLLEKGFAYKSGENIYFDTSKLENYHVFFNFKPEDLEIAVRDDVDEDIKKKNANDFVLWFTKSKFENQALKWESPWGLGYPGWHIECTGISIKHLGEYLDIHCGGIGNAFPHHTNEIAQSEAYLGHKWCSYWMHTMHLQTVGGKMSKSKGDSLTLDYLEKQGFSALEYRFFCLQSHYRNQLLFSNEILSNSAHAYRKLIEKTSKLESSGEVNRTLFDEYKKEFKNKISNDLNTAEAIAVVFKVLKDKEINDATKFKLMEDFDLVLGLGLTLKKEEQVKITKNISRDEIERLIQKRNQAKASKDFTLADSIRNELKEKGIKLIDTKDGTKYEIE